jgi:hypothetical protein
LSVEEMACCLCVCVCVCIPVCMYVLHIHRACACVTGQITSNHVPIMKDIILETITKWCMSMHAWACMQIMHVMQVTHAQGFSKRWTGLTRPLLRITSVSAPKISAVGCKSRPRCISCVCIICFTSPGRTSVWYLMRHACRNLWFHRLNNHAASNSRTQCRIPSKYLDEAHAKRRTQGGIRHHTGKFEKITSKDFFWIRFLLYMEVAAATAQGLAQTNTSYHATGWTRGAATCATRTNFAKTQIQTFWPTLFFLWDRWFLLRRFQAQND